MDERLEVCEEVHHLLRQSFGSLGSELRNDIVDTIRADEPAPIRRAVSRHA